MNEFVGRQIDQYLIQRHIDRGGMADVYLALDITLQRQVALKVLQAELSRDKGAVARFQREAETVARLNHPNIVQIYNIGRLPGGQPYLAMQYVEGGSLHQHLTWLSEQGEPISVRRALGIARQIAGALDTAHRAGVVHRDLKPGNILMRDDKTPVVTDLGIAAVKTAATRLTRTGGMLGTPHYMSPEQARGQPVDGRADIYALGIILYEMLAGKVPFDADSPLAVLHQHLSEPPPPLYRIRPDLVDITYRTVETCLQKDPADRFQTATQLMAALDHALEVEKGGIGTTPYPPLLRSRRQAVKWYHILPPVVFLLLGLGLYQLFAAAPPSELAAPMTTLPGSGELANIVQPSPSTTITSPIITEADLPTATFRPLPTHTATMTATPAATLSPSPTATATITSMPTNTPLPLPAPAIGSPTGRIVFTCYIDNVDDICVINADGSGETRLTAVATTDFYASFTPDGRQILFSSRRDGGFLMYAMGSDGSNVQRLGPAHIGGIYAPAVSPEGQRVTFTAAQDGNQQVWVMNWDGSQLQQLTHTDGNNVDPVWSPDGNHIAFASDRDGEMAHFIMNADGTEVRKLVTGVADSGGRSDWSPDGRWLAFYAGPRDGRDIYLAAIDGSVVYRLTDGGSNLAPSFSPDGNWIAFTSYRDGDAEIFIMRMNGSDVRQLTFNSYADWQPRWGP